MISEVDSSISIDSEQKASPTGIYRTSVVELLLGRPAIIAW